MIRHVHGVILSMSNIYGARPKNHLIPDEKIAINSYPDQKAGADPNIFRASFVILWAMLNNPHSIFTFSIPLRKNLRNPQQPFNRPNVCSTSLERLPRSSTPSSDKSSSRARRFSSLSLCETRIVRSSLDFLHFAANAQPAQLSHL